MKPSDLTIAIVTYKRPEKLKRCLESVVKQTKSPQEVLVIDNHPRKSANKVVEKYKSRLPVRYETEKRLGVPHARNKAIKFCKTKFLGFVDDDCVLDNHWIEEGTKAIKKQKTAYVLGKTLLLNKDSIIAQAQFYRHLRWFFYKFKGQFTSPFSVDTKNIIFSVEELRKGSLLFDVNMAINGYDSSDTDFGLKLNNAGLKGYYEDKMIVYHEEVDDFLGFIKKASYRGRLAGKISDKWRLKGEFVDMSEKNFLKWLFHLRNWPKEYRIYKKIIEGNVIQKFTNFLLIKIYDRNYLQGFLNQQKFTKPN